jgi:acylpyruvate hydrolase
MKPYTSITGPFDPIEYPSITSQLDYEGELGVVIGKKCRNVKPEGALGYIIGYTVFNDVSARDIQFRDGQWVRGKSFDTFAPVGPWIVTKDEVPDTNSLKVMTRVDGEIRQDSSTSKMIFKIPELVSFISMVMTLDPGDIIATGTPAGVGVFAKPSPKLLKVGQTVEIEIEKVGKIRNKVVGVRQS